MKLVIDAGNTRIKWAIIRDDGQFSVRTSNNFSEIGKELPFVPNIHNTIIADVRRSKSDATSDFPSDCWLSGTELLLPFRNAYQSPESLGPDRLANAAALQFLFPGKNALSVDLGTCIKFDFKDKTDTYLGGSISPGLALRYASLEKGTGLLPALEPQAQKGILGNNSQSSIHTGTFGGWIAEINAFLEAWNHQFPELHIIFTGGDCNYLDKQLLKNHSFDPYLTLKGLIHIMNFKNHAAAP